MKRFLSVLRILCAFVVSLQFFLMVSPTAMAQEMPAVMPPEGPCTLDINPCGNPSMCACPDGYEYNASVKLCSIENISQATDPGLEPRFVESSCSIQAFLLPIPIACTRDINPLGYPSHCACPSGTRYNELFAHCVIPLS